MNPDLQQVRDQQKETWNKFSPGWRKWDQFTMDFLKPMGDEIIRHLDIKENSHVLDVAAGTGEPGLTIASVAKNGKVVITDLADGMLEIAREHAKQRGLNNVTTIACDVSELPFEDNTFDAVSCRMGFMFFPDMLMAAKEMTRVLKPGGKIATSVWGAPGGNFWITATMGSLNRNMNLPPTPAGAPGMFRCSSPGLITDLFRQAGLKNVDEKIVTGSVPYGDNENYWNFMNDVVAPVVAAMSKADESTKVKIKKDVFGEIDRQYPGKKTELDYTAVVIWGEK